MSMLKRSACSKNQALRKLDPYLERETAKYRYPLPSREYILTTLAKLNTPLKLRKLCKALSIKPAEQKHFGSRLLAMQRDGQIIVNRSGEFCIASKLHLAKCRVQGHPDGYGFAIPDDVVLEDIFLPTQEMRQVFHGDIVMVQVMGFNHRHKPYGRIVEVLHHAAKQLVGHVHHQYGATFVLAEDTHISQHILIDPATSQLAKSGQIVVVDIIHQPSITDQPVGRIVEVLGDYAASGMEIEIALRSYDLPHIFSDAAQKEAAAIPQYVRDQDRQHRTDLRHLAFITIDGVDAKDFDDAVYAETLDQGWQLWVAIADVSHYVHPNSALDKAAYERGTSIYFPRRVISMLPEALSHGICSLNPNEERLSLVCAMHINHDGQITHYEFYPAIIRSQARLTYQQVWQWISGGGEDYPHKTPINTLYALFKKLLFARHQRGAIEFDSMETMMHFDAQGKIERIEPIVRNDVHRLIEECMLAANTCAADMLMAHQMPCLYRIHEGPTSEKLEALKKILSFRGLTLAGGEKPSPKDYAKLSEKIRSRTDAPMLQIALLRSMQQAIYSPKNVGHFGLAYAHYVHFTSPIRRYPDLLTHRAIKSILTKRSEKGRRWDEMGAHCSFTERRAEEASQEVHAWLKTYFMRDKVGEIFSGKISGVTNFGLFVLLDDVYIEGLIHISALGKDYFNYRPDTLSIVGERSGKIFQLGDAITIKVAAANLENRKIDFVLINQDAKHRAGREKKVSA